MEKEIFKIEILHAPDSARVLDFYESMGFGYRQDDRVTLIKSIESCDWTMVLATDGDHDIGGCYLNREPKYNLYRRMRLPELQDLRVDPRYRRRGVGEALVNATENIAKTEGYKGIGISVGLNADFGAAQRLYIRLGYIPDGQGVTYLREPVPAGEKRPIDDDLALMLMKYF